MAAPRSSIGIFTAAVGLLLTPSAIAASSVPLPPVPLTGDGVGVSTPGAGVSIGEQGGSLDVSPETLLPGEQGGTGNGGSGSNTGGSNPAAGNAPGSAPVPLTTPPTSVSQPASRPIGDSDGHRSNTPSGGGRVSGGDGSRSSRESRPTSERGERGSDGSGQREAQASDSVLVRWVPDWLRFALALLFGVVIALAGFSIRERHRARRAQQDALRDPLTGLGNRAAFDRALKAEWARAHRYDRPMSLLLLDIDQFKQINDSQGHMTGDRVLRELAALISGRIRSIDFAARFGGDEFVVICPETPIGGARFLAQSLHTRACELSFDVSIGIAEREPLDHKASDMLERVDAAMYTDKARSHDVEQPLAAA